MSSFDDLFGGKFGKEDAAFDKEAWAAKKQEERNELYSLADQTAAEISKDGKKFKQFLDVQSRFDRYSPTNALLILAQMPEATQLKDFDGWKEAGVSVQRKPRSVKILEPGKEYDREDGTRGTSFEVKRVFDVSQTRGRVRSAPAVKLDDRVLLKALIHRTPVPIQTVETLPNNMGALYDHNQQVIFVCRGMGAEDIFRSVSKELAHAELAGVRQDYNRSDAAFAAYSASYLLLNISPEQMSYVNGAEAGCGLMRYGNALVPFVNRFPADTELYKLITTKPGEGLFAKGQVDFHA